ncbi:MAG: hypothetical protein SV062_07480 [Thermodesulfobacteriota bacterium]|nr:hypothetical protein [Thermodesulfobacteriota bacterium]
MKPIIIKKYTDNGVFSHHAIIDSETEETILEDILVAKKLLDAISKGYEQIEDDDWICFSLTGREAEKLITI